MSVQSEIDRINGNVASTYTALSEMGATMPAQQNSDNLPGTVRTVPQGGGSGGGSCVIYAYAAMNEDGASVTTDVTPDEVQNAVNSGKVFIMRLDLGGILIYLNVVTAMDGYAQLAGFFTDSGQVMMLQVTLIDRGGMSVNMVEILPFQMAEG